MDVVVVAKALASPVRVAILEWLKDPECHFVSRRAGDLASAGVCASLIAEKAGIAAPTASRHLDVLRRAELIDTERITGWNYHRRNPDGLARARRLLEQV
ncbi:ArsR family transcriptional regulator (plasmid) [Pseudonocardia sp. EC080610-09]|uniref:ArsR/SmtB family transcription factor n=1 Tax=unclassified Pseudonocardia TaxID=2619320 RepID=UPI000705C8B2|nr:MULTISPECIES: helix-turn-helix domain-containing protein [unclassified Pseudonocardia]ALL79853.1 ArsR family transcriptional regulator [Pseudonocardia sp. EC080610-09]ALL85768.1 ArsR family transcriptional regulator [Pseudonocardia sp. EC080619-01]